MEDTTVATAARLNGVPSVNIVEKLRVASDNGRRMSTILARTIWGLRSRDRRAGGGALATADQLMAACRSSGPCRGLFAPS